MAGKVPAAALAGGDSVLPVAALGVGYNEQVQAAVAVTSAATAKGAPLTDEEIAAVQAQFPGADLSTEAAHRATVAAVKNAGSFLASLPGKLLAAIPWWLWLLVIGGGGLFVLIQLAPLARLLPQRD